MEEVGQRSDGEDELANRARAEVLSSREGAVAALFCRGCVGFGVLIREPKAVRFPWNKAETRLTLSARLRTTRQANRHRMSSHFAVVFLPFRNVSK
jgi:hypothetical protein